ncbi:Low density lipoprotein receptor class A cysteine rich [Echinococcus multilocularis]|uniref:Low density lipoprotein receptor class A cysteine rich n=1 Tax=Echinococcus multilocularis TaxID=6211 RepID=A0A087VWT1_ECHMU|nr:Low density lipoprotein receptor class A cysteine rich [Echinococcus multilocularis]
MVKATASDVACSEGFRCGDGSCIPPWQQCDGQINCIDGLDEPIRVYLADRESSAALAIGARGRRKGVMAKSTAQTALTRPTAKV